MLRALLDNPVVAASLAAAALLQLSFYLATAMPSARRRLEARFSPAGLASLALAAALVPYLMYSLPAGVFQLAALAKLAAVSAVPVFVFVVSPTRSKRLAWQDVVVLLTVGVAELGKLYRQIYRDPLPDLRVDFLGRVMMLGVLAIAYLSLRRLEGCNYQLTTARADWREGLTQFVFLLPIAVAAGVAIGFARFDPRKADPWFWPLLAVGTFLGMYAFVALFEELVFRGVLQNLLGPGLKAQAAASIVFGLVHLPFRQFPNWRFVMVACIAGWFYGQAWRRRGVTAAAITHALVVTVWRLWFQ